MNKKLFQSKVLAIIPARGGSKGILNKNISKCAGKPLLAWTAEAANGSSLISKTILSSNSIEIISVAQKYGIDAPFIRPEDLALDNTPTLPVIKHAVEWSISVDKFLPDIVMILQPTSPLRTSKDIDRALLKLEQDNNADSIVSVTAVPHNNIPTSLMNLKGNYLEPLISSNEDYNIRQLKPKFYARNGAAIYAFRIDCLLKKHSIYGNKILPYFMPAQNSVDIDSQFDLEIAEFLLQKIN